MVAAAVSVAASTVITGETAPEYVDTYPLASAPEFNGRETLLHAHPK